MAGQAPLTCIGDLNHQHSGELLSVAWLSQTCYRLSYSKISKFAWSPPHTHTNKMKIRRFGSFKSSWIFGLQISKCQITTIPFQIKSWQIWKFLSQVGFMDFKFQSATLPTPRPVKWKVGRFGSFKSSWIFGLQILKWSLYTPTHPVKWKVGRFGSFKSSWISWTSDFKVCFTPSQPPPPEQKRKVRRFGSFKSSWIFGLQISKCYFPPPAPHML